jgi:site-specific DNA recombinase
MKKVRCAIYTRKSTEEGLEQEFNSLDAQREACEAYIASQKGLGWICLKDHYDDGGLSGGSMARPALQRLLEDVEAGSVDLVIVYKVDRLTRSLTDFAKIVETLDTAEVSFASVTQQFNTSTSMGRMTLNVLMTFAQFEREVTAERIRDKIAASKKKGMWMGGLPPLGYINRDKQLVVVEDEADVVRALFGLYLEHGTVRAVGHEAERLGLRTKVRNSNGKMTGGQVFSRGHLYQLLRNPVYAGKVAHKGKTWPGRHEAVVDRKTWDAVQHGLDDNAAPRVAATNSAALNLLTGLLFDEQGDRLTPMRSGKKGKRYHYYISKKRAQDAGRYREGWRLPAGMLDRLVVEALQDFLSDDNRLVSKLGLEGSTPSRLKKIIGLAAGLFEQVGSPNPVRQRHALLDFVERIDLGSEVIRIQLYAAPLTGEISTLFLELPAILRRRGAESKIVLASGNMPEARDRDPLLVKLVANATHWLEQLAKGEATSVRDIARLNNVAENDVSRFLPLAFLAPDIIENIVSGRYPPKLTAEKLKRIGKLPHDWQRQREILGFND